MCPVNDLDRVLGRLAEMETRLERIEARGRFRSALLLRAGKLCPAVAILGLATWVLAQGLEVKTTDTATDIQRMKIETSSGVGVAANAYFMNASLGIGTTAPAARLHLAGDSSTAFLVDNGVTFKAKSTAAAVENYFWPRWTNDRMYMNYGANGFHIRPNGSGSNANTTMFMDNAKNVGIGTITPDVVLTIASSTTTTDQTLKIYSQADTAIHLVADTDNVTETDNPYVLFSQDGAATNGIIGYCGAANVDPQGGAYTGTANNDFLIGTISGNPVMIGTGADVKATYFNDGSVHFTGGYASAAVASSTGSAGFWFGDDLGVQTDPTFTIMEDSNDTRFLNIGVGGSIGVISVGAHDLYFKTGATEGSVNTGTTRVDFESDGDVGIGTTTAEAPLHVVNPIAGNRPTVLLEANSTNMTPRLGMVDTVLGAVTAAPAWFIDNLNDEFRIFRQPNITTGGVTVIDVEGTNNGEVGIGTADPTGRLSVLSNLAIQGRFDIFTATSDFAYDGGSDGAFLITQSTVGGFTTVNGNKGGADGENSIWRISNAATSYADCLTLRQSGEAGGTGSDFIEFYTTAGKVGDIDSNGLGTVNYNAFQGTHPSQTRRDMSGWRQGMIVRATGELMKHSESQPMVELADRDDDPGVYGIFWDLDPDKNWVFGDNVLPMMKLLGLGHGQVLVTDLNGDLRVGDYVSSSSRAGYGRRQSDRVLQAHTVGKALEAVNWDDVPVDPKRGFKWKMIAIVLVCG